MRLRLAPLSACAFTALLLLAPAMLAADVILDWNDAALAAVLEAHQLPPDGARTMALVHLAMFDAVNAVEHRYAPYAFEEPARSEGSEGSALRPSSEAAAIAAAHGVLEALFPGQRDRLAAAYAKSLVDLSSAGAAPDAPAQAAGLALGERVARACLASRDGDGTGAPNVYRPATTAGTYVPTTLPVSSEWAHVKPFVMRDAAQFRPGPPPALTIAEWARDFEEIRRLGTSASSNVTAGEAARTAQAQGPVQRTREQTDVARFWAVTGAPSWNPIVRALVVSARLDLLERARIFALVNLAATDAFIAVFDAKYTYNFWRPITAIRNGDLDGNEATARDAGWTPLLETPLHPEYPCAHCITAAAIGAVLESRFGAGTVPRITMTSPTAPGVTRRWERIGDYVQEVENARVWGGLHYRTSTRVGEEMGRQIGELAVRTALVPLAGAR